MRSTVRPVGLQAHWCQVNLVPPPELAGSLGRMQNRQIVEVECSSIFWIIYPALSERPTDSRPFYSAYDPPLILYQSPLMMCSFTDKVRPFSQFLRGGHVLNTRGLPWLFAYNG